MDASPNIINDGSKYQFKLNGRGERIDHLLALAISQEPELEGVTRSQIQQWIASGCLTLDGVVTTKTAQRIKRMVLACLVVPAESLDKLEPYDYPLEVVFEDDYLIVINKPAGLSMHPGAGNRQRTLLNALIARWVNWEQEFQDPQRLGIVHRLDQDTTGLVVVAKTRVVQADLSAQFANRSIGRLYAALVATSPKRKRSVQQSESGVIDQPIGRHRQRRTMMAIDGSGARHAVTHWCRLEDFAYGCLVEFRLETGRTHQIRVHASAAGWPVVGDRCYGNFSMLPTELRRLADEFGRQALHAKKLSFDHPITGDRLDFNSDIPTDMALLVDYFRDFKS